MTLAVDVCPGKQDVEILRGEGAFEYVPKNSCYCYNLNRCFLSRVFNGLLPPLRLFFAFECEQESFLFSPVTAHAIKSTLFRSSAL